MFAAVAKAAAQAAPQTLKGKIDNLYVDADGLCYFCAGSSTTTPQQSLLNVQEKLKGVEQVAGQRATLVCTASGSPKGGRYTIATVKPYQGNRGKGPKPANWAFLRDRMLAGEFGRPMLVEKHAEADDLCASLAGPRTALHYQDKDFRMMPGWHITWKDYAIVFVSDQQFRVDHDGLIYGEAWFWHQMLMGDGADNIPGIPKLFGKLCGEKRARDYLADVHDRRTAQKLVEAAYRDHYGDDLWWPMMREQGQLLWMRREPDDALDVLHHPFKGYEA
jgi:DNA polymerase-1